MLLMSAASECGQTLPSASVMESVNWGFLIVMTGLFLSLNSVRCSSSAFVATVTAVAVSRLAL